MSIQHYSVRKYFAIRERFFCNRRSVSTILIRFTGSLPSTREAEYVIAGIAVQRRRSVPVTADPGMSFPGRARPVAGLTRFIAEQTCAHCRMSPSGPASCGSSPERHGMRQSTDLRFLM